MEPKTKQSLLVTVVGVTLFVALLRLSDVLAFAAKLIDLVLPILAGGILALFINVPMTGLEKRLNRLFGKAKKQPSAKAIHLLSFFITLLGVVLVLVLALTLLIPELVQSFHSLYVQIEANIPRWTAYLNAQDADMGWLMNWLEGINWEQLLHKVTASIDTVLVNAVGAVSATVNIAITASFALIISVYLSLGAQSLGHQARTLVRAYRRASGISQKNLAGMVGISRATAQRHLRQVNLRAALQREHDQRPRREFAADRDVSGNPLARPQRAAGLLGGKPFGPRPLMQGQRRTLPAQMASQRGFIGKGMIG